MNDIRIPQISNEAKKRIIEITKSNYGFTPIDDDIYRIDNMLRNNYSTLHEQRVILELVSWHIGEELLQYRDNLGSLEFERILHEKTMFRYLTYASMCLRAGIPAGTISLCRTALETGLRERLAEELARSESTSVSKLPEAIWEKLNDLRYETLGRLISMADQKGIVEKNKIENAFQSFKLGDEDNRKVLDKFIHGDIGWVVDFLRDRKENTKVIGAEDLLNEYKIIFDMNIHPFSVAILKVTQMIAGILFYQNV